MVRLRKKGLIFTLTLVLMATLIFSLSIVYKNLEERNSERLPNIVVFDRVQDLSGSIFENLKDIVNIELTENSTEYVDKVLEYKEFIDQDTNIDLNISGMLNASITVGNFTTWENDSFDDEMNLSIGATNYSIVITTPRDVESCIWQVEDGTFSVHVKVIDPEGIACEDTRLIDENEENTIKIQGSRYIITIKNGGDIHIENTKGGQESIDLDLVVGQPSTITSIGETANYDISINFSDFNIIKEGNFSLLQN